MADVAHAWTDDEIAKLEKRLKTIYGKAYRELAKKQRDYLAEYDKQLKAMRAAVKAGTKTQAELDAWLENQAITIAYHSGMVEHASEDLANVTQRAADMANGTLPAIFAENANYSTFAIESTIKLSTAYSIYDEDTVRRLIVDKPDLLPSIEPSKIKGKAWSKAKMTAALTQGIMQGESIPNLAARLRETVGMEQAASIRAARTACTGAQNAGRVESYKRAQGLGIKLQQEWLATLDSRTRDSHRLADGQRVDVGEKFSVGSDKLDFPGDPHGSFAEVCNCRCTLVAAVEGVDQSAAERWSKLPEGQTYEQWQTEHLTEKQTLEWKIDKAQAAADKLKPENHTYTGIWKDAVTLDDYEDKKSKIQAKKDWFEQQIADPATSAAKIAEYQKHIDELDEFSKLGPEYAKQKALHKTATDELKALQKELKNLIGDMSVDYTQAMASGLSFATPKDADDYLRAKCGSVWRSATEREKDGVFGYTSSSGRWNRPLSGFEKPYNVPGSGWEQKFYKGPKNVWIDYEGKGDEIRAMTDIIARSTYDDDIWLRRGAGSSWVESILGVPYGTIGGQTTAELQQYVGVSGRSYSFTSCGSASGKGFSGECDIRILCPAGTQMIYAEPFSDYSASGGRHWDGIKKATRFGTEDETIIQRGASYEVVKIERSGYTINVELVVHPEDGFDTYQQDPAEWTGSKTGYKD